MNKRRKMYRTNSKAVEFLRGMGITKIYCVPHSRYQKDAFGVADIFYVQDGQVRILQTQSNSWHDVDKYQRFANDTGVQVMIFLFKDRNKVPKIRVIKRESG